MDYNEFKDHVFFYNESFIQYCFRSQRAIDLINSSEIKRIFTSRKSHYIKDDGCWESI